MTAQCKEKSYRTNKYNLFFNELLSLNLGTKNPRLQKRPKKVLGIIIDKFVTIDVKINKTSNRRANKFP